MLATSVPINIIIIFQENFYLHHLVYLIACPGVVSLSFEVVTEVSYVNVTLFYISQLPEF